MQIRDVIFVGSLAALVVTTLPALAKNSQTPRPDAQSAATSPCRAYQQAADGSWTELPCQQQGAAGSRPAAPRAPANSNAQMR